MNRHHPNLRWVRPPCWLAGSMLLVPLLVAILPQERIGCDFFSFWSAGKLLASGQSPYDAELQARIQRPLGWDREVHGRGLYDFMPYYYPPWLGLALTALVPLGYPAAKVAWVSLDFELLLVTGYLLRDAVAGVPRWFPMVVVPAFAFSIFSALAGQTAPLVLSLIAASSVLLERRRDRAAGGVLAWLTIKPQLTAVLLAGVLLWAVRRGRWGVVRGFILVLGLLCLASALVVPSWPVEMLEATRRNPPPTAYLPSIGATWLLVLKTMGLRGWVLWALYLAAALPLLAAVLWSALGRGIPLRDVLAVGLLAAFFVAPYGRPYDFPVLLVPLLVLPGGRCPEGRRSAITSLLLLTLLQIIIFNYFFNDINTVVNELGSTFFWIPLALTAAWFASGLRGRRLLGLPPDVTSDGYDL